MTLMSFNEPIKPHGRGEIDRHRAGRRQCSPWAGHTGRLLQTGSRVDPEQIPIPAEIAVFETSRRGEGRTIKSQLLGGSFRGNWFYQPHTNLNLTLSLSRSNSCF